MAEVRCNKKRLSINLSLFALTDQISSHKPTKSTKKFEDPNGVVGLGIVAAMNQNYHNHASLANSPRSSTNPIPIFSHRTASNCNQNGNGKKNKRPSIEEMEMCEEYTCVISHEGSNLVKKTEYFDGEFIGNSETTVFGTSDFLNACFLCNKQLQGLDIFMYRGEKAFCSAECRCKQISIDEHKEKFSSGGMKSLEYSASPCSGPMQFFAGVTVA